ncbi:GntR family transcriptional regulator [Olsenella sp. Marseille-P4559]|uniref:GntR family transcriptional regulator n=1 Tax=Olsenella sp. Marseille-P4559 TaxID=2364795 RepID=UPI00102FA4AD|nr:GntR family transcriptional regulator [Olsenella sp. Marseille-P4559]
MRVMGFASNSEPKYLQLREIVRSDIEDGVYAEGTCIPSENELSHVYGVTRMTVRNAIDALVVEGLLKRIQGKGVFVMGCHKSLGDDARGFRAEVSDLGLVPTVRVISKMRRPTGDLYASLFRVDPADEVYAIRRVNSVDGQPVSIERTVIPMELFPKIDEIDISVYSLYDAYRIYGHEVAYSAERLDIAYLSNRDARLLAVEPSFPVMVHDCVSYDGEGNALEHARSLRRGDLSSFTVAH